MMGDEIETGKEQVEVLVVVKLDVADFDSTDFDGNIETLGICYA